VVVRDVQKAERREEVEPFDGADRVVLEEQMSRIVAQLHRLHGVKAQPVETRPREGDHPLH
ncbi:MAG: hypothetical protein SGPRY_011227, partial [Prymnesium sp.]